MPVGTVQGRGEADGGWSAKRSTDMVRQHQTHDCQGMCGSMALNTIWSYVTHCAHVGGPQKIGGCWAPAKLGWGYAPPYVFLCQNWSFWIKRLLHNLQRSAWPSRSLKVIRADTDRSAIYKFLSVIHRNRGPISYHFRDKRHSLFTICGDECPISCVNAEACLTGWPNALER